MPYVLLCPEAEVVVAGYLCQIQQTDYSRHPEQSAAPQKLPHFHSVEAVLAAGHCSGCRESSMGICVGQEGGCHPASVVGLAVERLAAATVRGWEYWAAALGIRVGGRGLSGRRSLAHYPVESTTSRRLEADISGCVDVSNGVGVRVRKGVVRSKTFKIARS